MIKTLTLNPAVDKSVTIDRFLVDQVNRITSIRLDAGGKGLNVARILKHLGASTLAVAPVGGAAGRFLVERLGDEAIAFDVLEISGETRTNLKVVDPVLGTHTDINEPGPSLTPEALASLGAKLLDDLAAGDWVVFSGSVPAGVPKGLYRDWMVQARSRGALTVLDADGEAFRLGLAGLPDLVKPNRAELEAWAGFPLVDEDDLFRAVDQLRQAGASTVAVSLGSQGAWLFHGEGAWFAPGLKVAAQSTVGAGDALVAGLTWGLAQGLSPGDVLAQAVAVATASVVKPGTGAGDAQDIATFRARVALQFKPVSGRK